MRKPGLGTMLRLAMAVAVVAALAIGSGASAGAKGQANTTVTIKGGGGAITGEVKSPDENHCADNRKVLIFQVKNGNADKVATDRAQPNGGEYQWGHGFDEGGKYFGKVNPNSNCQGDTSKTVNAGHL